MKSLCGLVPCPRVCSRVCHCEAGLERRQFLLAIRAEERARGKVRVLQWSAAKFRGAVCERVRSVGVGCEICKKLGGCLLPSIGDTVAEVKRKIHRSHRVLAAVNQHIEKGGEK